MEPGDLNVMQRPPRDPRQAILSRRFVGRVVFYAGLITASTLGAFGWALAYSPGDAVTIAFMTLSLAQIWHLGNARSRQPVLTGRLMFANPYAVAAVVLAVLLQVGIVWVPRLAAVLHVTSLGPREWGIVLGFSLISAVVGQVARLSAST
jgi:Ca2+-transporting ATPase